MSSLTDQQCKPCKKGESPLTRDQAEKLLSQLDPEWSITNDGLSIARSFRFSNYYETMAFVNTVAMVAHQQDHHPDMTVSYNSCHVVFSTHSIGGLSNNDFICAAKTDNCLHL